MVRDRDPSIPNAFDVGVDLFLPTIDEPEVFEIRVYYEATVIGVDLGHYIALKNGGENFSLTLLYAGAQTLVWSGGEVLTNGSLQIGIGNFTNDLAVNYIAVSQIFIAGFGTSPCAYPGVPRPTPIAIDGAGLNSALMGGNAGLTGLPANLDSGVPNETGAQLFRYAKWIFSPSSADEIAGPFAPAVSHAGIGFSLMFSVGLVYGIIWAAVWLIRFAIFIFRLILEFIRTVVSVIGSVLRFFI
jgi:hypothetical protein